jgi:hypothetical protein
MEITNNYNLPEQIVRAVTFSTRPPQDCVISVTELIGPAWIRYLRRKHWQELSEDASERLWALLGQSVHYVVEQHELDNSIAEERLTAEFDGYTITGQADNYNGDSHSVEDWKVTSVWSFMNGIKSEWEAQLNIYAWLWRKNGFQVVGLNINAILRDWQAGRANGDGYPEIPFVVVPVSVWPNEKVEAYIRGRLEAHAAPAPCTPDEKWQNGDVWAVMKEGRKSAVKLHDSEEIANRHAAELGAKHTVVKRPGECTRCKSYCPVRALCEFNTERS